MIKTMVFGAISLLSLQFLTACAVVTPKLDVNASPQTDVAYIYGRFFIPGFWSGLPRMSLAISKEGYYEPFYGLQFDEKNVPSLIAVKPGAYVLEKIQCADSYSVSRAVITLPDGAASTFEAQAGKAYYVGDYIGETSVIGVNTYWKVTSMTDNYENTTVELKKQFPKFESIETVRVIRSLPAMESEARAGSPR